MGRVIMSKNEYDYHDIKKLYNENKHNEVSKIVKNREVNHRIRNHHLLELATEYNHTSLAQALLKLPMVVKKSNLENTLDKAISNGNQTLVDNLIENTPVNYNEPFEDQFGDSYFLVNSAVMNNHFDLAEHMIDKGYGRYIELHTLSIEKIIENNRYDLINNYIEEAHNDPRGSNLGNRSKIFLLERVVSPDCPNRMEALDKVVDNIKPDFKLVSYMLSTDYLEASTRILDKYKDNFDNEQLVEFIEDIILRDHNIENIDKFKDFIVFTYENNVNLSHKTERSLFDQLYDQDNIEMAAFVYENSQYKKNEKDNLFDYLKIVDPEALEDIQRYQKTEKIKDNVMSF